MRQWRDSDIDITEALDSWSPVRATKTNVAKQLALEIIGKTPVIYAGQGLSEVAQHWKLSFNSYAKHLAWTVTWPENLEVELTGWTQQPVHKPYTIIDLRSSLDNPETMQAFVLAERLLSGKRPAPEVVLVDNESLAAQVAWASALGEFVAVYVAILTGVSPTNQPIHDALLKLQEEHHE